MGKNTVTNEEQVLIETELRRGTSKSRIASLLNIDYDSALKKIDSVKENLIPEIGSQITFNFRESKMTGIIIKLLTNSAVVEIYWAESDPQMKDICEDRTIVNFKDIDSFIELPPQAEDKDIEFDYNSITNYEIK